MQFTIHCLVVVRRVIHHPCAASIPLTCHWSLACLGKCITEGESENSWVRVWMCRDKFSGRHRGAGHALRLGFSNQYLWFPLKMEQIDYLKRWRALIRLLRLPHTLPQLIQYINSFHIDLYPSLPFLSPAFAIPGDLYQLLDSWSLFSGPPGKADNTKVSHQSCAAFLTHLAPSHPLPVSSNSAPNDTVHFVCFCFACAVESQAAPQDWCGSIRRSPADSMD